MRGSAVHFDAECRENTGLPPASKCMMQASGHCTTLNAECAFASIVLRICIAYTVPFGSLL